MPKSLKTLRRELIDLFKENNIESPETESGLILMHALNLDKTQLIVKEFEISEQALSDIYSMGYRRIKGEPIQYIMGTCPFMDLEFFVNPSTLIPRPETELLVELVADKINKEKKVVWDIGCGSGCIGITLAYLCPNIKVYEIDISQDALDTAKKSAIKYGLDNRIEFIKFDILSGMPDIEKPDIIVSNPPYIPRKDIEGLQKEVRDFEPMSALDGGEDGLDFYRKIINDASLKEGDLLAFEIGYDQGSQVMELMEKAGYKENELIKDIAGLDRIVTGYR